MMKWIIQLVVVLFCITGHTTAPVKSIGIAVDVNDVSEIYPKQELTDMELTINLLWQGDERPDKTRYYQGEQVQKALLNTWWPYYQIVHSRGVIDSKFKTMSVSPDGLVRYVERLRVKVETAMDMHSFPFDSQVLKILIKPFGQSGYRTQYYSLNDKIKINTNAHLDEWHLVGTKAQILSNHTTPTYMVSLDYQRQSGFYLYKILIPLLVIVGIANTILWLPSQPAINRLAVVMTAMLTVVAFQWVVGQDMPVVSYITFLQAVLLFAFLLIGSKAVLIVVGDVQDGKRRQHIMYHARWVYPLILVLGLGLITVIWFN